MAGTNAYAAKKALMDAIAADATIVADGVGVSYSFDGKLVGAHREYVYGGRVDGSASQTTFMGGARINRDEALTVQVHVRVYQPGIETAEALEARACAISGAIENLIAADPDLTGVTGLRRLEVTAVALDSDADDSGMYGLLTLAVAMESSLQ